MLHLSTSYSNRVANALLNTDQIRERQQQQTCRSSDQLYRYNHESISATLRRDLPGIIILLVFLIIIITILIQIFVLKLL